MGSDSVFDNLSRKDTKGSVFDALPLAGAKGPPEDSVFDNLPARLGSAQTNLNLARYQNLTPDQEARHALLAKKSGLPLPLVRVKEKEVESLLIMKALHTSPELQRPAGESVSKATSIIPQLEEKAGISKAPPGIPSGAQFQPSELEEEVPLGVVQPSRQAESEKAFIQEQLAAGVGREEIAAEVGGLQQPDFDPVNTLIDIFAGGTTAARLGLPIVQGAIQRAIIRPVITAGIEQVRETTGSELAAQLTPFALLALSQGLAIGAEQIRARGGFREIFRRFMNQQRIKNNLPVKVSDIDKMATEIVKDFGGEKSFVAATQVQPPAVGAPPPQVVPAVLPAARFGPEAFNRGMFRKLALSEGENELIGNLGDFIKDKNLRKILKDALHIQISSNRNQPRGGLARVEIIKLSSEQKRAGASPARIELHPIADEAALIHEAGHALRAIKGRGFSKEEKEVFEGSAQRLQKLVRTEVAPVAAAEVAQTTIIRMMQELEIAETGQKFFREAAIGGPPVVTGVKSTFPDWYRELGSFKGGKATVQKSLQSLAEGKPPKTALERRLQGIITEKSPEAEELIGAPREVTTGKADLQPGDKFTIKGEEFEVIKRTPEEITLENGQVIKVDPFFDKLPIDGGVQGIERKTAPGFTPAGEALRASIPTEPAPSKTVAEQIAALEAKGYTAAAERLRRTIPAGVGEAGEVRVGKAAVPPKFKFSSPEVEKRFTAAQGVKKETLTTRAKEAIVSVGHKITREFEHLPRTAEFAQLRFDLLKLAKQKGVASDKAVRTIRGILEPLGREDYNLFSRKVILDDLTEIAQEGKPLPFGFTQESLAIEKSRLDAEATTNPAVTDAINRRQQATKTIKQDYIASMEKLGFNVSERLSRKNYFRHQVLEYMNIKSLFGAGKKLKTPSYRGFLKQRKGSELDINTDYIQAEHEVLAQMIHDTTQADVLSSIEKSPANIAAKVKAAAKKANLADWHEAIPVGYVPWQPREGNVFYFTNSIPANMAEGLMSGGLKELGVTEKDLRKVLAVGGQRKEFVVKEEIAETLDNLQIVPSQNVISQANKELLRKWKVWTLISPRRILKYNIRNMTGDADAVFIGNPSAFKKSPQAVKELWRVFVKGEDMPQPMQDWFDRGGMESTLQAQEMGELNQLKIFQDLYEKRLRGKTIPLNLWKSYWKKARLTTDFREAILRYSAYLDYVEQMQANPNGRPNNFGGSIPEEIMGLQDIRDRAYFLSNDLLGAYDRISVMGRALREHLLPFWSWKELNFKRYIQFAKNAVNDGRTTETVGRVALVGVKKTPYTAYRVGRFLIKATAFWAALQAWNNTMFPEEEAKLPTGKKSRPHIILGVDGEGNTITFDRIGVLGDFLEWFGLDAAPKYIDAWLRGTKTLKEIAYEMAEAPVNVFAQAVTPLAKIPAELVTRRGLFPDVFRPRTVRDRGQHLAWGLGLADEYAAVFGKPSRGYLKSLSKTLIYKSDPLAAAYYGIMFEEKADFLKKVGKYGEGFWLNPRGDALYNYKMALRFKDKDAADKYLQEYVSLGGTVAGIKNSLKRMHPLSGLSKADRKEFEQSLDEESVTKLKRAEQFYNEFILTTKQAKTVKQVKRLLK